MEPRRTLALSQDGPMGNSVSTSIPIMPGSTMKKPALRAPAARMSMAPGANARGSTAGHGQGSSQDGGAGGGMRRSTIMPGTSNGNRVPSGGMGMGVGPTPQSHRVMGGGPNSVRRQSGYPSAGRPSILPSTSQPTSRDPRPIRAQAFQQHCRENVESFCRNQRCSIAVSDKFVVSPTSKDFYTVFKWLIADFLDPCYSWPGKNPGDDVLAILKDLRYPGLDGISKTWLSAPGGERSWPYMLAMLSWLVDLAKAHLNWMEPEVVMDPLFLPTSEWPADHPLLEERLYWEYVSKMYTMWFKGEGEEFPEAEQDLREGYDRIQQTVVQDGDELETKVQKRKVELQQLQAREPPLKTLEDEYMRLMSDKTKFIAFIDLHKQKAEKIRQGITKARTIIADNEAQLETARGELSSIEAAVSAQNLSPDEVNRMNHERETLGRQLEELRQKISEASQFAYDQEMAVTKSMDRFEAHISDYTSLGHSIGTIPPVPDGPGPALGPGGVDFTVDLDLGVEDVGEVQSGGRRLRAEIWPALQTYGEQFRSQMVDVENGNIQLDDEIDRLAQRVERQKEEAANLDMKLGVVQDQAEEARVRLQNETADINRTIAKLEHEVAQIAMNTQRGVQDLKSQMETTRIEYKELRHKTATLQDSLSREIMSHIDLVINAKKHTETQLKGVLAIAQTH